jgi:hypothetical protein
MVFMREMLWDGCPQMDVFCHSMVVAAAAVVVEYLLEMETVTLSTMNSTWSANGLNSVLQYEKLVTSLNSDKTYFRS